MSANKHQPHVLVLPEDRANSEMINGFHLQVDSNKLRRLDILREAGGWVEVLNKFLSEHVAEMDRWPFRLMVLVLDLDGHIDRLTTARNRIPEHLRDRVFIIGVLTHPEELKQRLGVSYEAIGAALARDCRDDTSATWGHQLLLPNAAEVHRLTQAVRPLLFT